MGSKLHFGVEILIEFSTVTFKKVKKIPYFENLNGHPSLNRFLTSSDRRVNIEKHMINFLLSSLFFFVISFMLPLHLVSVIASRPEQTPNAGRGLGSSLDHDVCA